MTGEGGPLEVTLFFRLELGEVRSGDPGEGLQQHKRDSKNTWHGQISAKTYSSGI